MGIILVVSSSKTCFLRVSTADDALPCDLGILSETIINHKDPYETTGIVAQLIILP